MQWRGGRRSSNVSDQRGSGGLGPLGGGGFGGMGGGGFGRGPRIGGLGLVALIAFFVIANLMGVDPTAILNGSLPMDTSRSDTEVAGDVLAGREGSSGTGDATTEAELKDFVSVILASTEDVWGEIFRQNGGSYRQPVLVLFSGATQSACGYASAAMGPFYCPPDQQVYIDLDFYRDLRSRFAAPGDFAQAYVIAHEVGHHVQNLLGIEAQVAKARARMNETDANALSVRVELQADCFAGIWAHQIEIDDQNLKLEPGDIEEGLNAASAIGDDTLQKQATGHVVPDSFTHGSSAQRVRWFERGLESGQLDACDTFKAGSL
ncbi:neutral zinc metallopeptidase [Dongia sp.]|uniref:KPN_02809 family neutral zinc metallopeptidase n=1 Tax=Dongia sp. TaxID=1977262 RepID=UPI0035ADB16D